MRAVVALGLALGFAVPAVPLPRDGVPLEAWTGRQWATLSRAERLGYASGLLTGFWFADAARKLEVADPEAGFRFYAEVERLLGTVTAEEIVATLDELYAEPRRRDVPIVPLVVESAQRPKRRASP